MKFVFRKLRKKRRDRFFRLPRREGETEQDYRKRFHRAYLIRHRIPICFLQVLVLALCFSLPLRALLNGVVDTADAVSDPTKVVETIETATTVHEAASNVTANEAPPLFFFLQFLFLLGFEWFMHRLAREMRHRSGSQYRLFYCKLVAYGLFAALTLGLYYVLGRESYLRIFSITAVFNNYQTFLRECALWKSLVLFHAVTAVVFFPEPLYMKLWHSVFGRGSLS